MSHTYNILKINRAAKICFELYEYQPIKVMERHLTNLTDKRRQVTKRIINPQERKAKTFSQKYNECNSISSQNRLPMAHDTKGLRSVGERVLLLQQVEEEGIIEELLDKLRSKVRIMAGC